MAYRTEDRQNLLTKQIGCALDVNAEQYGKALGNLRLWLIVHSFMMS